MIQIFSTARQLFARRELDWRAASCAVYLVDDTYAPDLEVATYYPIGYTDTVLAQLTLTNQSVSDQGWCAADPMVFASTKLARPCGQAIVAKLDDNLALLHMEFPPISPQPDADNISLLFSQRGPGWFRL